MVERYTAKDNFKELELKAFWVKYFPVYPLISTQAFLLKNKVFYSVKIMSAEKKRKIEDECHVFNEE